MFQSCAAGSSGSLSVRAGLQVRTRPWISRASEIGWLEVVALAPPPVFGVADCVLMATEYPQSANQTGKIG